MTTPRDRPPDRRRRDVPVPDDEVQQEHLTAAVHCRLWREALFAYQLRGEDRDLEARRPRRPKQK